jgi:hypothetical protein
VQRYFMVFGLGTKHEEKQAKKSKAPSAKQSSAQANEAAEMLKKMQAKKDAGACPFC